MKKIFLFGFFMVLGIGIFAQTFWGGDTLSSKEAKIRWGDATFDSNKFKNGDFLVKAKMASSIISDQKFIGKSIQEIKNLFGPNDGFYFIDTYPAYIIQQGKDHSEETWQIVFLMDNSYKVRSMLIHKNCCEK